MMAGGWQPRNGWLNYVLEIGFYDGFIWFM